MVHLDKLWDDVVAGPQPERGLGSLRKITTQPLTIKDEGEGSRFVVDAVESVQGHRRLR
ncbi:Dormancyauxin associated [Corchorus olitorius]|uniref:Dormancyauxin associated n=1 Tax=Corchorus olitorius TaxID=93759 RepID=A0A1R3HDA4_9ROSI|nr:Dormancyauxin associated [Corchorus olitorius]